MALLFSRRVIRCALTALAVVTTFCCAGQLAAQEREPDIRIDTDGQVVSSLQFSANSDHLLVVQGEIIRRYDLNGRQFDARLSFSDEDKFAISADGSHLARINFATPEVQIIDLGSGSVLYTLPYPNKHVSWQGDIAFAGNSSQFVVVKEVYGKQFLKETEDYLEKVGLYIAEIKSETWKLVRGEFFATSDSGQLSVFGNDERVEVVNSASDADKRYSIKKIDGLLKDLSLSNDSSQLLLIELRYETEWQQVIHVLGTEGLTPLGEPLVLSSDDGSHYQDSAWIGDRPIVLLDATRDDKILVFDVRQQSVLSSHSLLSGYEERALSPNGRWLALELESEEMVGVYVLDGASTAVDSPQIPPTPRLVQQHMHSGWLKGLADLGGRRYRGDVR